MNKILIVTDDWVVVNALAAALEETADLRLAGSCVEFGSVAQACSDVEPDVVLCDMNLGLSLSEVAEICRANPACGVCLWARHIPSELAYQAMTAGIRGILRRPVPVSELLKCLRTLCRDEVWFEEQLMAGFFSRPAVRLTRRESELVNLLAQGMKNKEIAYTLSLSEGTVKVYLSRLFEKLHVKDRLDLALYGIRNLTANQDGDTHVGGPQPMPPRLWAERGATVARSFRVRR